MADRRLPQPGAFETTSDHLQPSVKRGLPMPSQEFIVEATELNLRSRPELSASTRIAVLPQGQLVVKIEEALDQAWWKVSTVLQGATLTGFVAARHLSPKSTAAPAPTVSAISEVHLAKDRAEVDRDNPGGRAYPLGEPFRPRRAGASPGDKAKSLNQIIDWLQVERSARYQPTASSTYCNIYAYDYCYVSGVYLPRVWWTPRAIADLSTGSPVAPRYGETVKELNANSLLNWLEEFGGSFAWLRVAELTELQQAANEGEVALISAQRTELNQPGHICAVAPEGAARAVWGGDKVTHALQSQAGGQNFRREARMAWWARARFRKFGFFRHA
jgi:hypothetical protein